MAKQQAYRYLSPMVDSEEEREPRNFFIWGHQPHFSIDVKVTAESLFKKLDDTIVPDTFVVAINTDEDSDHPVSVVEPDDHEFQPDDFSNVLHLARELANASPGPSYGYTVGSKEGKAWVEQEKRKAYRSEVRNAVAQTIEGACARDCPKIYVSGAREYGPYLVFSVLLIEKSKYDSHPSLLKSTRGDYSVVPSLIDATAKEFVKACWDALLSSFDGQWIGTFPPVDALLRAAGTTFMYTPFGACDNLEGVHGGFDICNQVSTLTYEKETGRGRLVFARVGHPNVAETIALRNPQKLRNFRAVRKLLQLSQGSEGLICDSFHIRGIGDICGNYNAAEEDLFCIDFLGHAKWELTHGGITLMRVEHGVPQLPKQRIQVQRFVETFVRLFPSSDEKQRTKMERIATAATELTHGTIVIVADNAAEETHRFGNQSTMIEPQPLSADLLERASCIDGAVLVTPDATCHAIGVILDGQVNDKGSVERGARFNSTIRYVLGSDAACIGLVVSDDGMVNLVPEYRPVMSTREIERKLDDLRCIVEQSSVDQREFNKVMDWIHNHAFYLSATQCEEVNQLIAAAEPKSDHSAGRRVFQEFKPHLELDKTYLRD